MKFFGKELKFNNNKIYHSGDKPTPSEIGAAPTSHNHQASQVTFTDGKTFQQKLEKWLSQPYERKGFKDDTPVIMTNNGLRVRSKSEKIMADYFDSIGLAFKYECPLYLKPYVIIYRDFTILSRRTGKEMYWEHEGMLDNPEYAKNAVKKIELYETNEIYSGDRLILTFETSTSYINTEVMKNLTRKYLL